MKRPLVLLVVAASLGLTACLGGGGKGTPAYVCSNEGAVEAAPPPSDTPLPPEQAGEIAKQEVATSETHTPDGRVPLVTVEQTGDVPKITSTPVATPEEGEAVAEAAAADGDLTIVEVDEPLATTTMDPEYPAQYAFTTVPFEATWNQFGGDGSVGAGLGQVVAVLDTGVQRTHPDLTPQQVLNGRTFLDGFDQPLAWPGNPGGTTDPNGHGTRLAGIIAALTNNNEGIAGAAPAAKILPVRVLNSQGQGASSIVANGVYWAVLNGATVINLSLGGPNASQALHEAIQWAVNGMQVPVIVSAGNSGRCGEPSYPGGFAETLSVAATNAANGWAPFSTTAPYVDIAAPGDDIRSTIPPNGYTTTDGTSFAAPYVAAAAAIVRATRGGIGAGDVYNYLRFTAKDLGSPGWDPFFGHGLVDPFVAATIP